MEQTKYYVAGGWGNRDGVRKFVDERGLRVTYKWWDEADGSDLETEASMDMIGILAADEFIFIPPMRHESYSGSAFWELGYAMGLGIPCWVAGVREGAMVPIFALDLPKFA